MTLRKKIILLGSMALVGTLLALWLQYGNYTAQSQAIEMVARNVKAVGALSHAAHELQRERGQTTIDDSAALAEQIVQSDAALSELSGAGLNIAGLVETLTRLRQMAAADTMERLAIRDGYSELLRGLIDEMDRLSHEPRATTAKIDINAHIHLVAAKEYLGQIRATLGYWIEQESAEPLVHNSLIRLKGLHDEELRKFRVKASAELRGAFSATMLKQEVEQTLAVIEQVTTAARRPPGLNVRAWWAMATGAIDYLKAIEDHSLELIEQKAESDLAQLRNTMRFGAIATLATGLAVLLLALSATTTLLRALDRAMVSMERIAESKDFRTRIPADTPDEIGHISRSFNQLLDIAERLLQEKDYLAATDPLTGINNRLRFGLVLHEEVERKRRSGSAMALIIFDIDHFKPVNDTYGHGVGDDVLQRLTKLVSSEIRDSDFFARWGGEEFVLLLRDHDCDTAMGVAEKLRDRIATTNFPVIGKLTCSFGLTAWKPNDTEESFVARADEALYTSKNGGRNVVTCEKGVRKECDGRTSCPD